MTRRAVRWGLVAAVALALAACAGRSRPGVTVQNDGPERMQSALRLAAQAEDAWKAGKTDQAIELYQKSLEESQELPIVWNNLGTLLMKKKNYMDGAEAYKRAADLSPRDAIPYYNVGLIYQELRRPEQALEYFVKALEREPRYLPALRAAVAAGKLLLVADEAALNRVRIALLLETDASWRRIMLTEQLRIENEVKNRDTGS